MISTNEIPTYDPEARTKRLEAKRAEARLYLEMRRSARTGKWLTYERRIKQNRKRAGL